MEVTIRTHKKNARFPRLLIGGEYMLWLLHFRPRTISASAIFTRLLLTNHRKAELAEIRQHLFFNACIKQPHIRDGWHFLAE